LGTSLNSEILQRLQMSFEPEYEQFRLAVAKRKHMEAGARSRALHKLMEDPAIRDTMAKLVQAELAEMKGSEPDPNDEALKDILAPRTDEDFFVSASGRLVRRRQTGVEPDTAKATAKAADEPQQQPQPKTKMRRS
jgi:hypothetical protein